MRGKLVRGLKVLSIMPFLTPASVLAGEIPVLTTAPAQLIISEIKVKNDPNGLNEFIEIYNNSDQAVNLGDYKLKYFNDLDPAIATTREYEFDDIKLAPYQYFVLARDVKQISGVELTNITSLKDTEGDLQLLGPDTIIPGINKIYDEVAWSDSSPSENLPDGVIKVPDGTQSSQRVSTQTTTPVVLDLAWQAETPTPFTYLYIAPPPLPEEETDLPEEPETLPEENTAPELPSDIEEQPEAPAAPLLPPAITELLPNPAPPFTDSLDEFVEIYNPNGEPLDVTGYKVQTGNTYSYSYELTGITIPGRGYITVTSGNTNLSLANTGGKARLLDTQGVVVSETIAYTEASEGQSWANIGEVWQWTTTPTPGAENILTAVLAATKTSTKKTSAAKPKTATPKAKAKTASAKTASAKKSPAKSGKGIIEQDQEPEIVPVHSGVLAIVGGLTLVYAGYEYRHDVLNRLYRFRRYRETRRAARG